jgi:hypothetical protein
MAKRQKTEHKVEEGEVPDYFTPELFDRDVKTSHEWQKCPQPGPLVRTVSFAEVCIRDAGTWIPVKVFDSYEMYDRSWLLCWNNNHKSIRVPMKIIGMSPQTPANELREVLLDRILPAINRNSTLEELSESSTMVSFMLYLHKHADQIRGVKFLPHYVNVEPIRWKIIKEEPL